MQVRLLGPPAVVRDGVSIMLPRSRKVRALLAYLVLAPGAVSRSRLCDLLWDVPDDPRGELRWCLSRLRAVLDEDGRRRVITTGDEVSLDLADCEVDALALERAVQHVDELPYEQLAELGERSTGELLEGIAIDGSPEVTGWLAAQRQRVREQRLHVVRALATRTDSAQLAFRWLDAWLQLAPFDPSAHQVMLDTLVRASRVLDAEAHLAATIRAFEQEGLDWVPLRDAWRAARARLGQPRVEVGAAPPAVTPGRRRASVAVMPFVDRVSDGGRFADGLTEDIIMQLAKLRALFVIARGSVFAIAERGVDPREAGRLLQVDYVTTGSVRRDAGGAVTVDVELADASDGRIVWTDAFEAAYDGTFAMLGTIVQRVVAAIAEEIESAETQRAILKPPGSLDAWDAYHRGLWHMYRFNGVDNPHAERFFRAAVELDPTFSRAYAGLSFTHFQNAFLDLTPDRDRQIALAFDAAGQSLASDDRDPAAHWAMGRALWLRGAQAESLGELERSIELSPNFALGHYTLGFVHSQQGDPRAAIDATNHSRKLSPFDPLQFAMLASRAIAHVRLDERAEAADWAVKAIARPNAHAHILAIAAECLSLAGRRDEGRRFVARIRERLPAYSIDDFLRAFRFDTDIDRLFRRAARDISL